MVKNYFARRKGDLLYTAANVKSGASGVRAIFQQIKLSVPECYNPNRISYQKSGEIIFRFSTTLLGIA